MRKSTNQQSFGSPRIELALFPSESVRDLPLDAGAQASTAFVSCYLLHIGRIKNASGCSQSHRDCYWCGVRPLLPLVVSPHPGDRSRLTNDGFQRRILLNGYVTPTFETRLVVCRFMHASAEQSTSYKRRRTMRHRMLLKATLVLLMGVGALATPKRAPAASSNPCYVCGSSDICSDTEGAVLCEVVGGEVCPVLNTCEWPWPTCASNQVVYTCMQEP